ncbi:MAG: ABC transporter ATP-binding protein, partial [Petrotogales bacterium]
NKVFELLELLGMRDLANRYPADLSGGQQQRVSLGRSLVYDPGLLLLDEPLANIDAKMRVEMREEIRRIQKKLGIMTLYVTHDQEEAMSIADRLAVFKDGKLMQVDIPYKVYINPASLFVADFIGEANFFPSKIIKGDKKGARVKISGHRSKEIKLNCLQPVTEEETDRIKRPFDAMIMVRPEHLRLTKNSSDTSLTCSIRRVEFLGNLIRYKVWCKETSSEIIVDTRSYVPGLREGGKGFLSFNPEDAILFYHGEIK